MIDIHFCCNLLFQHNLLNEITYLQNNQYPKVKHPPPRPTGLIRDASLQAAMHSGKLDTLPALLSRNNFTHLLHPAPSFVNNIT